MVPYRIRNKSGGGEVALFLNRNDAAQKLAEKLSRYKGKHPLVLAIPRGAVTIGELLAQELSGELDLVLVRKLGSQENPEFAIGSVDESGWTYLSEDAALSGATSPYIERERQEQLGIIRKRRNLYTSASLPVDPSGRIVIVVDDGLATGATMIAALHSLSAQKPERLIAAVPVAAEDSIEKVRAWSDEVVCLAIPQDFRSVGQFYSDFPQITDDEVREIMQRARKNGGSYRLIPPGAH